MFQNWITTAGVEAILVGAIVLGATYQMLRVLGVVSAIKKTCGACVGGSCGSGCDATQTRVNKGA